jgi:hypothetical protein
MHKYHVMAITYLYIFIKKTKKNPSLKEKKKEFQNAKNLPTINTYNIIWIKLMFHWSNPSRPIFAIQMSQLLASK